MSGECDICKPGQNKLIPIDKDGRCRCGRSIAFPALGEFAAQREPVGYVPTYPPWIPVEERLPDEDGLVIVFAQSCDPFEPMVDCAWYNPESGWSRIVKVWADAITHWMPLPKPPEVRDE